MWGMLAPEVTPLQQVFCTPIREFKRRYKNDKARQDIARSDFRTGVVDCRRAAVSVRTGGSVEVGGGAEAGAAGGCGVRLLRKDLEHCGRAGGTDCQGADRGG